MIRAEIVGLAAAALTTVSFVPQALKALRERDTRSLSLGMYVIFTVGVALWGVYGYLRHDWVMILANLITGGLSLAILIAKVRYDVWGPGKKK